MKCIPDIYCICVSVVYGKYICHHSKFILGVSEYVSKSQKMARPHRRPMSKRLDCYELREFFKTLVGMGSRSHHFEVGSYVVAIDVASLYVTFTFSISFLKPR